MRRSKITVFVVGCVFALLLVYLFWFKVEVSQAVVHYRFNKVHRVLMGDEEGGAGLHFKIPLIDRIQPYDRRVRVLDSTAIEFQLKDRAAIVVSTYAAWRVADVGAYGKSEFSGNEDKAVRGLRTMVDGEMTRALADMTFSDFVSIDEGELKFDQFEAQVRDAVQQAMDQKEYGLKLVAFGVTRTALSETPSKAVLDSMKAELEDQMKREQADGKRKRDNALAEANQKAGEIKADAEAEAQRIRSQGEAAEAAQYAVFAQEPELAIFLHSLDAVRTIAEKAREAGSPITFVMDATSPVWKALMGPQGVGVGTGAPRRPADAGTQPESGTVAPGRD